ncbi:MAG: exosome complex RNA-binding protein Csl4 [Sulfolobales archaeon]
MSNEEYTEKRDLVTPGSVIGVIEEFLPGEFVYERDGYLISSIVGNLSIDMNSRVALIKPFKEIKRLSPGVFVYALVTHTRGEIAMTRILGFDLVEIFKNPLVGVLHVSQIPSDVKTRFIDDLVRVGEIIYAKILSKTQPYFLSMRSQKASIVVGLCPRCGSFLGRAKERLICPRCGYSEIRKPITNYLYRLTELKRGV